MDYYVSVRWDSTMSAPNPTRVKAAPLLPGHDAKDVKSPPSASTPSFVARIKTAEVVASKLIGEGAFKKVYVASWNGLAVAKCEMMASPTDTKATQAFEQE